MNTTTEIQTEAPSPLLLKLRRAQNRTLTRLQKDMIVLGPGNQKYRVDYVNESRARIVPLVKQAVAYIPTTGKDAGKCITFHKVLPGIDISPNAELEILERRAA